MSSKLVSKFIVLNTLFSNDFLIGKVFLSIPLSFSCLTTSVSSNSSALKPKFSNIYCLFNAGENDMPTGGNWALSPMNIIFFLWSLQSKFM